MNRRLTDHHIRSTCRDLLAQHGPRLSGRLLRRTLKVRYGAAGRTERVFRIWRELVQTRPSNPNPSLPIDLTELQRRLVAAEKAATNANARAELSALREQAHQDKWAGEIDRLRQQLSNQPGTIAQIRVLQDQLQRTQMELLSTRAALHRYEESNELLKG